MDKSQIHSVDEVLFSFSYGHIQQASRCNSKLQELMKFVIIPELEASFAEVGLAGIRLELDTLVIDLGSLAEEDISEELGRRIRPLLVKALRDAVRGKMIGGTSQFFKSENEQVQAFYLFALETFLLKGYFPAWISATLDILYLIDFLISSHPTVLSGVIRKVSLQSESARRRIASLEDSYYDRIISVLAPQDAEWMIGYRSNYLQLHQKNSNLPGDSEGLKIELNLFILTFIVNTSGTKFNRLDFSYRFLNDIANHYNLDFRVFLKELSEYLNQNSIENQLFKDFKEAVIWVGDKKGIDVENTQNFIPNSSEIIEWLNNQGENESLQLWLERLGVEGTLFSDLSDLFPSFWRKLSTQGLTKLIKVLGGEKSEQWLAMTYTYLAWYATRSEAKLLSNENIVKGIFDSSYLASSNIEFLSGDLSSWYSKLVLYSVENLKVTTEVIQELIELGLKAGVYEATLIVIRAESKLITGTGEIKRKILKSDSLLSQDSIKNIDQVEEESPRKSFVSHLVLLEYLREGTLSHSFRNLSRSDIRWLISDLIKTKDTVLLKLLKQSISQGVFGVRQRILQVLGTVNRDDISTYINQFAGPQTISLLNLHSQLSASLSTQPRLIRLLDREIWKTFLEELTLENRTDLLHFFPMRAAESYLLKLSKSLFISPTSRKLIQTFQSRLQYDKALLVYLSHGNIVDGEFFSLLESLANRKTRLPSDFSLLNIPSLNSQSLRSGDIKKWSDKLLPFESLAKTFLQKRKGESIFQLLQSGEVSPADLKREVEKILDKDVRFIFENPISSRSTAFQKMELQEISKRFFIVSKSDPTLLIRLIKKNRNQFFTILASLFHHMKKGDRRSFANWITNNISKKLKIDAIEGLSTQSSGMLISDYLTAIELSEKSASAKISSIQELIKDPENDFEKLKKSVNRLFPSQNSERQHIIFEAFLIYLSQINSPDQVFLSQIEGLAKRKTQNLGRLSLLNVGRGTPKDISKNTSEIRLATKNLKLSSLLNAKQNAGSRISEFEKTNQSGIKNDENLKIKSALELDRDLRILLKSSTEKLSLFQEIKMQEIALKVYQSSISDSATLIQLFERNERQFYIILVSLYHFMKRADWNNFSKWLTQNFLGKSRFFNDSQFSKNTSRLTLNSFVKDLDDSSPLLSTSLKGFQKLITEPGKDKQKLINSVYDPLSFDQKVLQEVIKLLSISKSVFSNNSLYRLWLRVILQSTYQHRANYDLGASVSFDSYLAILLSILKKYSRSFNSD